MSEFSISPNPKALSKDDSYKCNSLQEAMSKHPVEKKTDSSCFNVSKAVSEINKK